MDRANGPVVFFIQPARFTVAGLAAYDRAAMIDPVARKSLLFDAKLTPHRSLSPRGFLVLMAVICAISFIAGMVFFLAGAWPVVGFLGLDVLLIYVAFRVNYHQGRMFETLELTEQDLVLRRVDHWGKESRWRFQPTWLQVLIDEPPAHDSQLVLRSHGRSVTVGAFLTPDERLDLARALRRALAKLRCAPDLNQTI